MTAGSAIPEGAAITIEIPVQPVAKGRPRMTRSGHAYTPAKTRAYEKLVKTLATEAMRGRELLVGALSVVASVFMTIPQSWSARKKRLALEGEVLPTGRPDLDNLIKAAVDALNEVVFADDSQIVDLTAMKRYGEKPLLKITIAEVA